MSDPKTSALKTPADTAAPAPVPAPAPGHFDDPVHREAAITARAYTINCRYNSRKKEEARPNFGWSDFIGFATEDFNAWLKTNPKAQTNAAFKTHCEALEADRVKKHAASMESKAAK